MRNMELRVNNNGLIFVRVCGIFVLGMCIIGVIYFGIEFNFFYGFV